MSQTQNASLALFVLLCVTCLLRQASGFALQAAVGLRQPATENAIRTPAVNSCAYRVGGPAPQFKRGCAGAGSLRAALEVQQTNRLEPGTVLVAGPDNYGHTAFKVRFLAANICCIERNETPPSMYSTQSPILNSEKLLFCTTINSRVSLSCLLFTSV